MEESFALTIRYMLEDYEKPFYRSRRAMKHLFQIHQGTKAFNPKGCDGCREIKRFLTEPDYRGDEHFPVGVEIDRDVLLDPSEVND